MPTEKQVFAAWSALTQYPLLSGRVQQWQVEVALRAALSPGQLIEDRPCPTCGNPEIAYSDYVKPPSGELRDIAGEMIAFASDMRRDDADARESVRSIYADALDGFARDVAALVAEVKGLRAIAVQYRDDLLHPNIADDSRARRLEMIQRALT